MTYTKHRYKAHIYKIYTNRVEPVTRSGQTNHTRAWLYNYNNWYNSMYFNHNILQLQPIWWWSNPITGVYAVSYVISRLGCDSWWAKLSIFPHSIPYMDPFAASQEWYTSWINLIYATKILSNWLSITVAKIYHVWNYVSTEAHGLTILC